MSRETDTSMKQNFKCFASIFLSMAVGCAFTSCSNDNDEPNDPNGGENTSAGVVNPKNVFTGQMPSEINGSKLTHNAEGFVTKITTSDGKVITFEYPVVSRAAESTNTVVMTVDEGGDITYYDMTIGDNGFVSRAYVKYKEPGQHEYEEGTWTLTYDNQGHLTKAFHDYTDEQGEDDYTVTIQWDNDNIVKTYKDNGWDSYTYQYVNSKYPQAIENKGALFMFEDIYPIEVYDLEWVYYAGMLGKGPKNLAVSDSEIDEGDTYTTNYIWTFDSNGYPTVFDVEDDDHPGSSTVKFTWN